MFWGFSPAIDFLHEMNSELLEDKEDINILIIGASDARHVLQTMAKYYTHSTTVSLKFYVVEVVLELVARQMLLLTVGMEPGFKLGPLEKARLWMELYGNTLLRHASSKYLIHKSVQLVHMITDTNWMNARMPLLDPTQLKYMERDGLENIFKFWSNNNFEVVKLWDERLRKSLGVRYDSREGAFDWDYSMKLKDVDGAGSINSGEYKNWRRTGVAFSWAETDPRAANPSLASGIVPLGDEFHHMGYMGDIRVGPFFTFGLTCEDQEMMRTYNGIRVKRATDIFERNLLRIFYEIETQEPYIPEKKEGDAETGVTVRAEAPEDRREEEKTTTTDEERILEDYSGISGAPHKVVFLPRTALRTHPDKPEFNRHFQAVFVAQNVINHVSPDLARMADRGALLIFESKKYLLGLPREEVMGHANAVRSLAEAARASPLTDFDPFKHDFALYRFDGN